ncbi:MAG: hypothetical protein ACYTEZ_09205 [Planctomycetota bacterium]|jgi:hypothetical protein
MFGRLIIGAAALAFLAYAVALVRFAELFPAPGEAGAEPLHIIVFVIATVGVALLHVGACLVAHRRPPRLRHVLLVAAAGRLLLLFGAPTPVLEGDPERARFDSRLVNQGLNPYEFKPVHLMDEDPDDTLLTGAQYERLTRARAAMTASNDAPRPEDVRRPDLRTHITPLALWAGSIADRFKPASTRGFAFAALVADALAIWLLILALRKMRLPVAWVIVYAWSPVLLKEVYCTLATEAFLMPALAGLILCIVTGRRLLAAVPLAICGGIRHALLLLLPVFSRRIGFSGAILATVLFVVPFLPFQTPDVPAQRYFEGDLHVWRHYEYNSMLENVLRGTLRYVPSQAENTLTIAGVTMVEPGQSLHVFLAKIVGLLVVVGVVTYLVIRIGYTFDLPGYEAHAGLTDLFILLAMLLVVSPVLHPWHALWLLPVMVVRPSGLAWLLLPSLVCLSYLTHLVGPEAADLTVRDGTFSFRIFEFGLFGVLLLVDFLSGHKLFNLAEPIHTSTGTEEELAYGQAWREEVEVGAS